MDEDGFITLDEVTQVLRSIHQDISDEEIRTMLDDIDTNCDGKIQFEGYFFK